MWILTALSCAGQQMCTTYAEAEVQTPNSKDCAVTGVKIRDAIAIAANNRVLAQQSSFQPCRCVGERACTCTSTSSFPIWTSRKKEGPFPFSANSEASI